MARIAPRWQINGCAFRYNTTQGVWLTDYRAVTPGLKRQSLGSHGRGFIFQEVELLFAVCIAKVRLERSAQWLRTAVRIGSSSIREPWVRPGQSGNGIGHSGPEQFLNGLHVNEAVVTAVARGWPGISSQFSAEL